MKIIDYPIIDKKCDVIFLSKTSNKSVFDMTTQAINSLKSSEVNNHFRIIVVETEPTAPQYDVDLTLNWNEEFNYNGCLNLAFDNLSDCEYVYVSNNDVLFENDFFSQLVFNLNVFDDLGLISPWCPYPQQGVNPLIQKEILEYAPYAVYTGVDPIRHINGWSWLMKKNVLDLIRPFPLELKFWHQDNCMAQVILHKLNKKCGQCTSSRVRHFGQKSYSLIEQKLLYSYTTGSQSVYMDLMKHIND